MHIQGSMLRIVHLPRTGETHYSDIIVGVMASQITSLMIIYSIVYSGADQRKHQSSASLAFVRGIRRWLVNSPHKWPVTRKMFPFDDVIRFKKLCLQTSGPDVEDCLLAQDRWKYAYAQGDILWYLSTGKCGKPASDYVRSRLLITFGHIDFDFISILYSKQVSLDDEEVDHTHLSSQTGGWKS